MRAPWTFVALLCFGLLAGCTGPSLHRACGADVDGLQDLGAVGGSLSDPVVGTPLLARSTWVQTPDGTLAFADTDAGLTVHRVACDGRSTATGETLAWPAHADSSAWRLTAASWQDGDVWLALEATHAIGGGSPEVAPTDVYPVRALATYRPGQGASGLHGVTAPAPEADLVLWGPRAVHAFSDSVWRQDRDGGAWQDLGLPVPAARSALRGVVLGSDAVLLGLGADGGDALVVDLGVGTVRQLADAFPAYAWLDDAQLAPDGDGVLLVGAGVGIDAAGRGNEGALMRLDLGSGRVEPGDVRLPRALGDVRIARPGPAWLLVEALGSDVRHFDRTGSHAWRFGGAQFRPNQPPTAAIEVVSVDPEHGRGAGNVTVSAAGSQDPDGRITGYRWAFAGVPDEGQFGNTVTHWARAPSTQVRLTVYDDLGAASTVTLDVAVPCRAGTCVA